jgi:hypothetical protein
MISEVLYCCITIFISVIFWIPSHMLASQPCSPFVMMFSPSANATLGLVGIILLAFLLLSVCVSISVIGWDLWRPPPPNRLAPYLEFDPSNMEELQMMQRKDITIKRDFLSFGLGLFCLYVPLDHFRSTDSSVQYFRISYLSQCRESHNQLSTSPR